MTQIKRVIALGFFDGVHLGHAALLKKTKERAQELGATPAVISFDAHPDTFVKGVQVPLINSPDERKDIVRREFDIDDIIIIHFDAQVMKTPWRDFIRGVIEDLGAAALVIGHDFNCGYKGEGTAGRILGFCSENRVGCDVIDEVVKDGVIVSSTYIRTLLQAGEIERANEFLGRPHMLSDTIRGGYKLGRTLGTPTINMRFSDGVIVPRYGVYAAKVFLEDGEHNAVTNIGVRPTFGGESAPSVESFILDFDGDLYGRQARVEFHRFLRPECKFESGRQLKAQIELDAQRAREYFEHKK